MARNDDDWEAQLGLKPSQKSTTDDLASFLRDTGPEDYGGKPSSKPVKKMNSFSKVNRPVSQGNAAGKYVMIQIPNAFSSGGTTSGLSSPSNTPKPRPMSSLPIGKLEARGEEDIGRRGDQSMYKFLASTGPDNWSNAKGFKNVSFAPSVMDNAKPKSPPKSTSSNSMPKQSAMKSSSQSSDRPSSTQGSFNFANSPQNNAPATSMNGYKSDAPQIDLSFSFSGILSESDNSSAKSSKKTVQAPPKPTSRTTRTSARNSSGRITGRPSSRDGRGKKPLPKPSTRGNSVNPKLNAVKRSSQTSLTASKTFSTSPAQSPPLARDPLLEKVASPSKRSNTDSTVMSPSRYSSSPAQSPTLARGALLENMASPVKRSNTDHVIGSPNRYSSSPAQSPPLARDALLEKVASPVKRSNTDTVIVSPVRTSSLRREKSATSAQRMVTKRRSVLPPPPDTVAIKDSATTPMGNETEVKNGPVDPSIAIETEIKKTDSQTPEVAEKPSVETESPLSPKGQPAQQLTYLLNYLDSDEKPSSDTKKEATSVETEGTDVQPAVEKTNETNENVIKENEQSPREAERNENTVISDKEKMLSVEKEAKAHKRASVESLIEDGSKTPLPASDKESICSISSTEKRRQNRRRVTRRKIIENQDQSLADFDSDLSDGSIPDIPSSDEEDDNVKSVSQPKAVQTVDMQVQTEETMESLENDSKALFDSQILARATEDKLDSIKILNEQLVAQMQALQGKLAEETKAKEKLQKKLDDSRNQLNVVSKRTHSKLKEMASEKLMLEMEISTLKARLGESESDIDCISGDELEYISD